MEGGWWSDNEEGAVGSRVGVGVGSGVGAGDNVGRGRENAGVVGGNAEEGCICVVGVVGKMQVVVVVGDSVVVVVGSSVVLGVVVVVVVGIEFVEEFVGTEERV